MLVLTLCLVHLLVILTKQSKWSVGSAFVFLLQFFYVQEHLWGMSGNISRPVIHVIICGLLAQWVCVVLAVSMCCFSRRWFTPVSMQLTGLSSFAAFQCVRLRRSCSVGTCTRKPFWWSSFQWRKTGLIPTAEIWSVYIHFHCHSWNMILLHQTDRRTHV